MNKNKTFQPHTNDAGLKELYEKDSFDVLNMWYDAYNRLVVFIGTIGFSIVGFSLSYLLDKVNDSPELLMAVTEYAIFIKIAFVCIGFSLLLLFINIVSTYNWYVTGVDEKRKELKITFKSDEWVYRNNMGKMKFWGNISFFSGNIAGAALFIGVLVYCIAIWLITSKLLNG